MSWGNLSQMESEVLAAVDIGTNSIHLIIARVAGPHAFEVLDREKEMVRLGSEGGDLKHLDDDAMSRGISALSRFKEVADVHNARMVAVATSAVREAENRGTFLNRARTEAGVSVEVISGFEEARLIHLGVLQALEVFDQRLLLCDIGGGSTELLLGTQGESLLARSFKLGSIRLTRRFFDSGKAKPDSVEACRDHVRATLASFARTVKSRAFDVAVGSSGTIGSICSMALAKRGEAAPHTWNFFELTRKDLDSVVKSLVKASAPSARAKLPGLEAKRADIILAGALILEGVFEQFELKSMHFSEYALREGVLLDAWRRRHGGSLHHLSDLRKRSVDYLAQLMDEDLEHSAHVTRLALDLFDQTEPVHGLGDDAREYLEAAALLCNLGLFLSHAGHHRHSYYMIRNSEHLTGFTDREIELIAQIARYHRKSPPASKHAEFSALSKDDQRLVRCCAGLLRIAIGLDRTHSGRVQGVVVRTTDKAIEVIALAKDDADLELEIFSAGQRAELAAEALGLPVEIEQVVPV